MASTHPKHIGRYQIVSQLAEGTGTLVFLAIHRNSTGACKPAVVKQIQQDPAWPPEKIALFLDEVRLTARLNHANIVKTYQLLTEGNASYLVMEHLEGQPLSEILRRLPPKDFSLEERVWILSQVLSGLHYAHGLPNYDGTPLGIVHGEVNPVNVFVTYLGDVKLLGFGMAKFSIDSKSDGIHASNTTSSYRAPEHLPDVAPDPHWDIYSVGMILREALLRIPPATDPMIMDHSQKQTIGAHESLQVIRPDLPTDLTQICDRAMAPNAADRYASAAEFQYALRRFLTERIQPVEPAALAIRLQTYFEVERQAISKLVSDQVAAPQEIIWGSQNGSDSHQDQVTTKEVPIVLEPPRSPRGLSAKFQKFSPKHLGLAVLVLTIPIVAVIRWDPREPPARVTQPTHIKTTPVPKPVPPRLQPAISALPQTPPPEETIHVTINVAPKGAKLSLDGRPVLANPFQATVPKDQTTHTIAATAPGFIPFSQSIEFSNDLHMEVALRPHHTAIHHGPKPRIISEPPQLRPQPTPVVEPGMHLTRSPSRRIARPLDEKDPYFP